MPESSPALSEFDLIRRYFTRPVHKAALGVGDDCALIEARPGHQLAISTDMLVSGRHFFPDVSPRALGHKALAVNLSDLAAMGAEPRAFTLALALPEADAGWLAEFAAGMLALADDHGCELIGGDTTKGPLTLSITVFGEWLLPEPDFTLIRPRMEMPTPRVALGLALRGVAHAALDISDGLIGDLGHILERSSVGAIVDVDALPRSEILDAQPEECQRACVLAGGDDYELCFTAPVGARETIAGIARRLHLPLTHVGSITPEAGLRLVDREGNPYVFKGASFDHFAAP